VLVEIGELAARRHQPSRADLTTGSSVIACYRGWAVSTRCRLCSSICRPSSTKRNHVEVQPQVVDM